MSYLKKAANKVREIEERWYTSKSYVWGEDTGFDGINRIIGGFQQGSIMIGGRPSHGKSALCGQFATNVATNIYNEWSDAGNSDPPGIVLVYSPEMTLEQIIQRYATQSSGVPIYSIQSGIATQEQRDTWLGWVDAFEQLEPVLQVVAGDTVFYEDIINEVTELSLSGVRIRLVVVDYLQLIEMSAPVRDDVKALATMAKGFHATGNKYGIPIVVASQLNRNVERDNQTSATKERAPQSSDFKGAGGIEESSDVAGLLHRPPEPTSYNLANPEPQKATLDFQKNRHGRVGTVDLLFYPDLVRFEDARTRRLKAQTMDKELRQ